MNKLINLCVQVVFDSPIKLDIFLTTRSQTIGLIPDITWLITHRRTFTPFYYRLCLDQATVTTTQRKSQCGSASSCTSSNGCWLPDVFRQRRLERQHSTSVGNNTFFRVVTLLLSCSVPKKWKPRVETEAIFGCVCFSLQNLPTKSLLNLDFLRWSSFWCYKLCAES